MAHLLRFERNGVYINLVSGNYSVSEFTPQSPGFSTVDFTSELDDGGERPLTTRRNVTETIELLIQPTAGQTMANAQAALQAIEAWFRLAEEYQNNRAGYPVYVEWQPNATTGIYRSEILSGKVTVEDDMGSRWSNGNAIKCQAIYTRRFYWEGPEAELALAIDGAAKATGGVTVYNHDDSDSGHGNWVEVAAADVAGVLPAPVRLELGNTYNVSATPYTYYIGENVFSGDFTHFLEGENSAYSYGSDVANSIYSGGHARQVTVSSPTSGFMAMWGMTAAALAAYAGRDFRPLARMITVSTDIYVKLQIRFPSAGSSTPGPTTVYETEEVLLSSDYELTQLPVIQLPSWLKGETSQYPVDLCLLARKVTGSGTITIDYIALMPLDGYRILTPKGYGVPYGGVLIDDGIRGTLYVNLGTKAGYYIGFGDKLMVWPGLGAKFRVLIMDIYADAVIARTTSVRMYYRPRRLTV